MWPLQCLNLRLSILLINQSHLRTTDATGKVQLLEEVKMVMPGNDVTVVFRVDICCSSWSWTKICFERGTCYILGDRDQRFCGFWSIFWVTRPVSSFFHTEPICSYKRGWCADKAAPVTSLGPRIWAFSCMATFGHVTSSLLSSLTLTTIFQISFFLIISQFLIFQ